jgi:type VI protein secretion system component VasF
MWTDGIAKDVASQSFSDPVEWVKYINRQADMAQGYKPSKRALNESMRVQARHDERRPYLDAAEELLAMLLHGDGSTKPEVHAAYDHIMKCVSEEP